MCLNLKNLKHITINMTKNKGSCFPSSVPMARVNEWNRVKHRGGGGGSGKGRWDVAVGDNKKKKENEGVGKPYTSFFVTEFGDQWKAKDLLFEFKSLGELEEAAIPPRRDTRGRRFGFVRFSNVKDEALLALKLDNVVLDGKKIFTNLPKFHRKTKEEATLSLRSGVKGIQNVKLKVSEVGVKNTMYGAKGGKSYAEAVSGSVASGA